MDECQVRVYPDPCLRINTKEVSDFSLETKNILRSMVNCMYIHNGIGLAAPQVGLGISAFVVDAGEGLRYFVNPEIADRSGKSLVVEEGCLSLPGFQVKVRRPEEVTVRAQDENGTYFMEKFQGLEARAVQHEMDHLKGRLIIDRLDPLRKLIGRIRIERAKSDANKNTCEVKCDAGKRDT